MTVFHAGEVEMQERVGVRPMAERVGTSIRPFVPPAAQEFLRQQPFVIVGGIGNDERVLASLLSGEPGFAYTVDERTVRIEVWLAADDPLSESFNQKAAIGMIALEPATRRRMRLNGEGHIEDGALVIKTREVYANCPKYIQKRTWERQREASESAIPTLISDGTELSNEQRDWIERADTFFIASYAEGGADASHRGGTPGFMHVLSPNLLQFPDYAGNAMFNTLGNIQRDSRVGLILIDWDSGATLQLSGRARVLWDDEVAAWPAAQRGVELQIERVIEKAHATALHWQFVEASPFNPPL